MTNVTVSLLISGGKTVLTAALTCPVVLFAFAGYYFILPENSKRQPC